MTSYAFRYINASELNKQFATGIRLMRRDDHPFPHAEIVSVCKFCGILTINNDVYGLQNFWNYHFGNCTGAMATPDFPEQLEAALKGLLDK